MKKILLTAICLMMLSLALCGCAKDEDGSQDQNQSTDDTSSLMSALEGCWQEDAFDSGYIFKADGTGTDTFWDLTFTYSISKDGTLSLDYDSEQYGISNYTFTVSGDELTMTRIDEGEDTQPFTYKKTGSEPASADDTDESDTANSTDAN